VCQYTVLAEVKIYGAASVFSAALRIRLSFFLSRFILSAFHFFFMSVRCRLRIPIGVKIKIEYEWNNNTYFFDSCQYCVLVGKKRFLVCLARQGSEGGGTPTITKHTKNLYQFQKLLYHR